MARAAKGAAQGSAENRAPGIVVAAPASGSGKTTVALGLMRELRRGGLRVAPFKVGPDYIDAAFHGAACGRASVNLDGWAMRPEALAALAGELAAESDLVLGEGVMGLFDGATDGTGSTADLAALTGWPVLLVVDASGQGASAAAVVHGFASWRDDIDIAGVVFNRLASARHENLVRDAIRPLGIPVLGCIPRLPELELPERHLGLVQASEHAALETFLNAAADALARHADVGGIREAARPSHLATAPPTAGLPPIGKAIAIASDDAFRFAYPHVVDGWRRAGAEVTAFSPLADQPPPEGADAVYLPGGYPELHAPRLAAAHRFLDGLRAAAARGAAVYGECGGYMVLGENLTDAAGARHRMAGLLPVETSFAERRLHLGYRAASLVGDGPLGAMGAAFRGHEFHYAAIVREDGSGPGLAPLFALRNASGEDLGTAGLRHGTVMGSFVHLIDAA